MYNLVVKIFFRETYMKKRFFAKIISLCLMLTLAVGIIVPITTVNAEAKNVNYVIVPESSVGVSKMHAVSTTIGAIGTAVKAIGAIKYASDNAKTLDEFLDMTLAYFSGNAAENERLDDLESTMLDQFEITQKEISNLRDEISALSAQIDNTQTDIMNKIEYESLENTLERFYDDFFETQYGYLLSAYDDLQAIYDGEDSISNFKKRMDTLYASARGLDALEKHLTIDERLSKVAIFDDYFNYLFLKNGVTSANHPKYQDVVKECQLFALKLYAADAMQKYCLAFTSAYQLNYVKTTGTDYPVENVSVPDNKYSLSAYLIQQNIDKANAGIPKVAASLARSLAGLYHNAAYVGYNEAGGNYYAPTSLGEEETTLNVYYGSEYQLYPLSDEIENLLLNDFSFAIRGASGTIISDTGRFTVSDPIGSSFSVAYVYGEDTITENDPLDNYKGIDVYTIKVNVIERPLGGGYGNVEAPYLIGTADHLIGFASKSDYHQAGVHTKLTADINVSGKTVPSVGYYYGSFDGGNHTVSGFTGNSALLSRNYGTIKNVTYSSMKLEASGSGGATLGGITDINYSLIENCHVKVSSLYNYRHNYPGGAKGYTSFTCTVGALVGDNEGTVRASSVTGTTVKGVASTHELFDHGYNFSDDDMTQYTYINIGGCVGVSSGTVENCYIGNTTLSSETKAAYYRQKILWEHTYNRVKATVNHGATVGSNSGTVTECLYYDITDSKTAHAVNASAKKSKDDSFVTDNIVDGVNGVQTSEKEIAPFFTSIEIDTEPSNKTYMIGDTLNRTGLEVKDNKGNYIYGYTVSEPTFTAFNKYTVTVTYQGLSDTFELSCECVHKNTTIGETTPATCKEDGVAAGLWCNDCDKYIGGNTVIAKSNLFCIDGTNDHKCDLCLRALPLCYDDDKDHECDVCSDVLSVCADGNSDYKCDYCAKNICTHSDTDSDHLCNLCGLKFTECADASNDHKCDVCGKTLTYCTDSDDHYCDKCGDKISECADKNKDHLCDVCRTPLSTCLDANSDHKCDTCGASLSDHSDLNKDHTCDYCNGKASDCKDENKDHICDICGTESSICIDADRNHACDVCAEPMGTHAAAAGSHFCAYCTQRVSNCKDENNDHDCDVCVAQLSSCADADNNHFCDLCAVRTSVHHDENDHKCDICGEVLSTCADTDTVDHKCDVCSAKLSECYDDNNDHNCDYCKAKISDCKDDNNDHICEYCGAKASECYDADDHLCDICEQIISKCKDTDNNHRCDVCSKILSECGDTNKDHYCEICAARLSKHDDADEDGDCDYCFVDVENHKDDDGDGLCDICKDPWEPWQMPWWGILLIVFGVIGLLIGGFFLIYWLCDL